MLNRRVERFWRQKKLAAKRLLFENRYSNSILFMTTRTLFFLSFTTSLLLTFSVGAQALQAETTDQPTAASATSDQTNNQESPAKSVKKAGVEKKNTPPPVKDITTTVPFVLKSGFRQLPEKPVEEVRLFEGEAAFLRFVDEASQTVWPIGTFASGAIPKDEPGFRRVLCAQAGKLGADYVVIFTDHKEIQEIFHPKWEGLVYCAYAYKRVPARLGIERDHTAAQDNVTKVSGFLPGSQAEQSGLHVGDIIIKVDGTVPGDGRYWSKAVRWKVGDKVKVEIERDGKPVELDVELSAG
jgi:hypothetical protein